MAGNAYTHCRRHPRLQSARASRRGCPRRARAWRCAVGGRRFHSVRIHGPDGV